MQHIAERFEQFQKAYQAQNYGFAYDYFMEALREDPSAAFRYFVARASGPVNATVRYTGRAAELAARLDGLLAQNPSMNMLCDDDPHVVQRICDLRESNIKKGLPSIVLVTAGKAASVSVANIFNSGFNLPSVAYSLVTLEVIESWARDYARGGACYTTHLRPTAQNIMRLKRSGIDKVIVHVRDPRQTLLSMMHHVSLYPDQLVTLSKTIETLSIAEQIDELMDFFVSRIQWIIGWMEAETELDVMFSTFEEFVSDKDAFVQRYLDFYKGPIEHFSYENALGRHSGIDYHFRKGEIAEWRRVLPWKQAEYLSNWIPKDMKERFGWPE